MYQTIIIGGGPAGSMAAIQAVEKGHTLLIEQNKSLGKKLLITGKGRCNLTTSYPIDKLIKCLGENSRFFYGALTRFSNRDTMRFFEKRGLELVEERGHRVFPKSGEAHDVLRVLESELRKQGVAVKYNCKVVEIKCNENFTVVIENGDKIESKNLIIATGGKSYPTTGSTGDGYKFAEALGHTIIDPKPALVSMIVENQDIRDLAGLSLKNIELSFYVSTSLNSLQEPFISKFGEMLFTHKGISGPIVLDMSKHVGKKFDKLDSSEKIIARVDLKPALSEEQLYRRINKDIEDSPRIYYGNLLKGLLPSSLIATAVRKTSIKYDRQVSTLRKEERKQLLNFLKNFTFTVDELSSIKKAIVTAGGIKLDEINPTTMESKLVNNLHFAGEVINLDGPTGGFNLQIAWSTGFVAGDNVAIEV